ncbi:ribonuclease HII [Neptuniibacter pectenicola]|jgi:ribonuclease HII|uniref:ribonuclease HII n=1 Tax=Neptuniibacter pectenicola TaxID=1806669 RepID=UPI000836F431|nr:ribonuclease HII [Neptuniibacter pectenicola]|tara:strand:- start:4683 stop:5282 length:600 start_codon:yes stop_codon:yes gene_type:complete
MESLGLDFGDDKRIAGVDEVGRGPLIGNVVAAAVILDPSKPIIGLADSKKLSEKRRQALSDEILEKALSWCIASASPAEIDELNILHATMLAMQRAVQGLHIAPEFAYIDGNRCPVLGCPSEAIVKGDSKVAEISAASIIAKVARDKEMEALDKLHPEYGFAKHKGYPTVLHMDALEKYGPLPQHRRTFKPVRQLLDDH